MDSSDEKSCEGVTHVCDPNVKFGCKDSGERGQSGASWVGGGHLENLTVTWCYVEERAEGRPRTLARVECQHLLQVPDFFISCVNLTEKVSRFMVGSGALQRDAIRQALWVWTGLSEFHSLGLVPHSVPVRSLSSVHQQGVGV